MLDCRSRSDHLDYGEMLKPPYGYILERAITSTYSIDLNTLLSIPVALVFAKSLEGELTSTRFQILEGIRKLSQIIKVYHQKGQVHIPSNYNWLFAYLEDVLVPVLPDETFSSFHPKVWILKYVNTVDAGIKFRTIILSRNLTFDRSWDIAGFLEGEIESRPVKETKPLVDFVRWLNNKEPFEGYKKFLNDLSRTRFITPDGYTEHAFHFINTDSNSTNPVFDIESDKALIISPFLDDKALDIIVQRVKESPVSVFSNKEDFQSIPPSLIKKINPYYISEVIVDGETIVSDGDNSHGIQQQNLHAKTYLFESKTKSSLFLGSANTSIAAKERNTEFLLELIGPPAYNKLLNELIGKDDVLGPFKEYIILEEHDEYDNLQSSQKALLRRLEYQISQTKIKGQLVRREGNRNYDFTVSINLSKISKIDGVTIKVQPLKKLDSYQVAYPGINNELQFENFDILSVSRFLAFKIEKAGETYHKFLICIDIEGLPDDRLDNLYRAIIDSSEKFFEYIRFILTEDISKDDILKEFEKQPDTVKNHADVNEWFQDLPIYENLLVAASRNPKKLQEVDEIIKRLDYEHEGKPIIPPPFRIFWEKFTQTIFSEGAG